MIYEPRVLHLSAKKSGVISLHAYIKSAIIQLQTLFPHSTCNYDCIGKLDKQDNLLFACHLTGIKWFTCNFNYSLQHECVSYSFGFIKYLMCIQYLFCYNTVLDQISIRFIQTPSYVVLKYSRPLVIQYFFPCLGIYFDSTLPYKDVYILWCMKTPMKEIR